MISASTGFNLGSLSISKPSTGKEGSNGTNFCYLNSDNKSIKILLPAGCKVIKAGDPDANNSSKVMIDCSGKDEKMTSFVEMTRQIDLQITKFVTDLLSKDKPDAIVNIDIHNSMYEPKDDPDAKLFSMKLKPNSEVIFQSLDGDDRKKMNINATTLSKLKKSKVIACQFSPGVVYYSMPKASTTSKGKSKLEVNQAGVTYNITKLIVAPETDVQDLKFMDDSDNLFIDPKCLEEQQLQEEEQEEKEEEQDNNSTASSEKNNSSPRDFDNSLESDDDEGKKN